MNNVGNYAQPLDRTLFVEAPLLDGYTTLRLRGDLQTSGTTVYAGTMPVLNDNLMRAIVSNTGMSAGTVQLMQRPVTTGSYRVALGSPVVLQPGGRSTISATPIHNYIEMTCSGGGPTKIRVQITSRIEYQEQGFARSETIYPQQLWAPAAGSLG